MHELIKMKWINKIVNNPDEFKNIEDKQELLYYIARRMFYVPFDVIEKLYAIDSNLNYTVLITNNLFLLEDCRNEILPTDTFYNEYIKPNLDIILSGYLVCETFLKIYYQANKLTKDILLDIISLVQRKGIDWEVLNVVDIEDENILFLIKMLGGKNNE